MRNSFLLFALAFAALLIACSDTDKAFDAEGVFEADEVIVSSEVPGKIIQLNLDEGTVSYLSTHIERSFAAARAAVIALDEEVLERGRTPNRAFAAELFRDTPR